MDEPLAVAMIAPALRHTPHQEGFLEELQRQGVVGLYFDEIQQHEDAPPCPPSLWKKLRNLQQVALFEENIRTRELARVLSLLQQAGTRPILIKGEALAHSCYPRSVLRSRQDTDIFIDMSEIQTTRRVLRQAGYRISYPLLKSHQFTAWQEGGRGGLRQVLDVHWRISNSARYARIWDHRECRHTAIRIDLHGQSVLALDLAHSLVLACVHRMGNPEHDANRLIWLYDMFLLLQRMEERQVREFIRLSVEAGVASECVQGLRAMSERLGVGVQEHIVVTLSHAITTTGMRHGLFRGQLALVLADLRELPGWTLKRQLLRELLLPEASSMKQRHGGRQDAWLPWLHLQRWGGGLSRWLSMK